jgi:DHA1 family tetracycline resistance protein-like MFS transporter
MRASTRHVVPLVTATVFLDLVGFGIVLPLLPLYVDHMGGTSATVGALLSSFALAQLVATPLLGRASDRFGRRSVILLSLAGNVAAMLIFARAAEARYLPLLFVSRILAGATSGNLSACQAAIADTSEGPERTKGMGRLGAGISLGMMIGPFLGGMASKFGEAGPPLAAAAFALADLLAVAALMPETRGARTSLEPPTHDVVATTSKLSHASSIFADKRIVIVLILYFLTFLCMTDMQVGFALLSSARLHWTEGKVGSAYGLFGAVMLVVQSLLIGRLSARFRPLDLLRFGSLFTAVALAVMGFSETPVTMLVGLTLLAIGFGMVNPLLASLASEYAGSQARGTVLGFAQSSGGLARTLGPVAWGLVYKTAGGTASFLGGTAIALLAAATAFRASHKERAARLAAPAALPKVES